LLNTTAEEIATVFEKFEFGKVRNVDLVCRQKVDGNFVNYSGDVTILMGE
jgi:hypothetical protein